MLRWLLALLSIPFLDAVLLAFIVTQTPGFTWVGMVAFVVLTGLVGLLLVRAEGRRTVRKMQRSLAQGKPPTNELLDGGLLIAAGALLLTPGLVTDILGFVLVLPFTRIPIRMGLKRYVIVPYVDKQSGGFASGTVWTYGFPDGNGPQATDVGADGTVNLGRNEYRVDADADDDPYTIEFADDDTTDDPHPGEFEADDTTDDGEDTDAVGR